MGISVLVFLEWVFCSLVSASNLILRQLWPVVEKEPTQDGVWNKASRKGEWIWNRIEGAQRECVSSNYVWSICVSVGWDGFWLSRKPLPK